jgi:DNA-binding transcriptional regulator YiaG
MSQPTPCRNDVKEKSYATYLKALRKELGLSRKEAGEAWGLSWRTIETWEQGRREPTGLYRERLEEVLKAPEK